MTPRIFGVDYQFLSCGSVFTDGLEHAAHDLGIPYMHARWDAPNLPHLVAQFAPDLLFVVHGRKFARRLPDLAKQYRSAVWLLDEPYEVDDTQTFSKHFDYVFVNDQATLGNHRNTAYLPVCYDPHVHHSGNGERSHAVGFIGGGNATRERYLSALARVHLLSYVIGGAWGDADLNRLCLSRNIPASMTADLYRQTRIVVNVFRERHHYNREKIPARALNPRVYEALACGALVVSEWRPEIEEVVPGLPTFRSALECISQVRFLLENPGIAETLRQQCAMQLSRHTYANRLKRVIDVVFGQREAVA